MPAECGWCGDPIPPWMRRDARTCSQHCRQSLQRFRVAPVGSVAAAPMWFGYADPPYPGLARRYYKTAEVDHHELVKRLVADYPDGWALSTSSKAMLDVGEIIVRKLRRVRIRPVRPLRTLVWIKGPHPGDAWHSRDAYEVVFVYGGRPHRLSKREQLDNVLLMSTNARQPTHPGALVGMKPAGFCEWLFRQLGAMRGDTLDDLFPGSGAVTRAWKMYTREPSRVDERRFAPSRLAGAARQLRKELA